MQCTYWALANMQLQAALQGWHCKAVCEQLRQTCCFFVVLFVQGRANPAIIFIFHLPCKTCTARGIVHLYTADMYCFQVPTPLRPCAGLCPTIIP